VSAARNRGFLRSRGSYLVFLDADDRLAPRGIVDGLDAFKQVPDAAAAVGLSRIIDEDGAPVPFEQQGLVDEDPYRELLRSNFIWMPAQVLYRRDAFSSLGGFDRRVDACADYDLYLRTARTCRLAVHRCIVADYRTHDANMSADAALMLRSVLRVLERQRPYTKGIARYQEAQAAGRRFWRKYYEPGVIEQIRLRARTPGSRASLLRTAAVLLRHHPAAFATHLRRNLVRVASAMLHGSRIRTR
jgi:glycosyltransferase involved in cell wall biosynthesis